MVEADTCPLPPSRQQKTESPFTETLRYLQKYLLLPYFSAIIYKGYQKENNIHWRRLILQINRRPARRYSQYRLTSVNAITALYYSAFWIHLSRSVPFCAAGMDLPFLCNQCTLWCIEPYLDNRTSLRRSHTPAYISIRMCEPLTGSKRKRTRPHKRGALTQKQAHDSHSCALEGTFVGDRPSSYDNIPGQLNPAPLVVISKP